MKRHSIVGWVFAAAWLLALPALAVEYRLQVAHLEYLTFSSYLENSTSAWRGEESMGGLETRLDKREFPTGALIPGREVLPLQDPGYGGKPVLAVTLPATKEEAWTTLVWQGEPGDTVAFVVKSDMAAWQEARMVATNAEGVLRRLSIGGPGIFGRQWQQVPEVSYHFIANAVDRKTFAGWMERTAKAINGISVVVGRSGNVYYKPDWVYVLLKQPPEPRTFKLVIGWQDHDDRGTGGSDTWEG